MPCNTKIAWPTANAWHAWYFIKNSRHTTLKTFEAPHLLARLFLLQQMSYPYDPPAYALPTPYDDSKRLMASAHAALQQVYPFLFLNLFVF